MGQKNRFVSDTGIGISSPSLQTHHTDYTLSIVGFSLRLPNGVIQGLAYEYLKKNEYIAVN